MEYICGIDSSGEPWCIGEEIVRCRDCKNYHDDPYLGSVCVWYDENGGFDVREVTHNGFCAWGERP